MRVLRSRVAVRRRRPRPGGWAGRQVHALLRPARGRARACVREVVPDRLDPVRSPRGAGRDRLAPGCPAPSARHQGRLPVRSRRRAERGARRWPGLVLPVDRAARALRTSGPRGLAGAGERRPSHARRGRRRPARGRRDGRRLRPGRAARSRDTGTGEVVSREHGWEGKLEHAGEPAELAPEDRPPDSARARETDWVADPDTEPRDIQPALGARGGPASWTPAKPGAPVAIARPDFGDARWSYLYKARDTGYADVEPAPGQVAEANRRMRGAPVPEVNGPFIHAPVWSGEVAAYFWLGGMASGSAFVALACDIAGDHRSAAIARKVALGVVTPAPVLLIADLGRPDRFLNMMRIFKPRSPMNTGAWCLVAFSGSGALAVGADLVGAPKVARTLGALTALLGSYLGSYTGVLLACTAVPVWSGSRTILGPAFVATATATGAAATRLVLVARGLPQGPPPPRP